MALIVLASVVAGALVSFGVVGFLTGLVLVPFGIALIIRVGRNGRVVWPGFLVGLGLGPVILLRADIARIDPPTGTVPAFWVGVLLLLLGVVLGVVTVRTGRRQMV